jgi:hypothetical protein
MRLGKLRQFAAAESTHLPIPMREPSPISHPWSITMCPTVTFLWIVRGTPSSVGEREGSERKKMGM